MNNENNNIIFDNSQAKPQVQPQPQVQSQQQPQPQVQTQQQTNNNTVDYNKLYNANNNQALNNQTLYTQQANLNNNVQPTSVEQIIPQQTTPLEQNDIKEDKEPNQKKGITFVIVLFLIIIISVLFLFPIIFKGGF